MTSRVWSSFVAIFRKEFLHITRDRATLMVALTIPIFQMVLFGFIDQTVRGVPTVVVDQDQTRESRELIDELRATRHVRGHARDAEPARGARGDHRRARARRRRHPARLPRQARAGLWRERARAHRRLRLDRERAGARRGERPRRERQPRGSREENRGGLHRASPLDAAHHPVQPRRPHRELHHPGARRDHASDRGDRADGDRHRARARDAARSSSSSSRRSILWA